MSKRSKKPKQLALKDISEDFQIADIPAHVVTIHTEGKSSELIVAEMMAIPLDKSILLDFLIGYQRGDYGKFNEEQLELYRLQQLLNSRYSGTRFDFMGDNPISAMVRNSIANETWKPKLRELLPMVQTK